MLIIRCQRSRSWEFIRIHRVDMPVIVCQTLNALKLVSRVLSGTVSCLEHRFIRTPGFQATVWTTHTTVYYYNGDIKRPLSRERIERSEKTPKRTSTSSPNIAPLVRGKLPLYLLYLNIISFCEVSKVCAVRTSYHFFMNQVNIIRKCQITQLLNALIQLPISTTRDTLLVSRSNAQGDLRYISATPARRHRNAKLADILVLRYHPRNLCFLIAIQKSSGGL
jgi:hypothetical protein